MDLCKYIKIFYNYSILFSLENNIMNNNYSYLIIINSNKLKTITYIRWFNYMNNLIIEFIWNFFYMSQKNKYINV